MANYIAKGRQLVVPMTNKTGGAVAYGDVVVVNTGTADAFDDTATASYSAGWIGVVVDQDGIAGDAVGRVCISGYVAHVHLAGAAAIGDFLFTNNVAKQGISNAARGEGAFGVALTASATPTAYIWGVPDSGAAGGDVATDAIWDAAGDLVKGTGANTADRLAIGTAYQLLRVNSGATAPEWVSAGRVLISEQTPSGTTTVTWDSIPSTFNTLEVELMGRTATVNILSVVLMYYNNDTTAANYFYTETNARDTTIGVAENDAARIGLVAGASAPANSSGFINAKIMEYKLTTYNKLALGKSVIRTNTGQLYTYYTGHEWESANAITRVDLVADGNFAAGSVARLYGVF